MATDLKFTMSLADSMHTVAMLGDNNRTVIVGDTDISQLLGANLVEGSFSGPV